MAKRQSETNNGSERRHRRSAEEIIADLQKRIEEVRQRQETRQLKGSPAVRGALAAAKALDRGLALAEVEGDTAMRHALADARMPVANMLAQRGINLPKTRRPKGPRPK